MNTQLVDSIIQVVRALPRAEQTLLIESLNRLFHQETISESTGITEEAEITLQKTPNMETPNVEDAWAVWQSLGDDAVPGKLENTSTQHDRYLYAES
jgi:hypothetical protein